MKRKGLIALAALSLAVLTLWACGGGGGGSDPVPGALAVTVTEKNSDPAVPVEGARIAVIDGETGAPVDVLVTDASGNASITMYEAGKLLLRVSAQGYVSSPASPQIDPLPYDLVLGATTPATVELESIPDADTTLGTITGKVLAADGTTGVAWALVICKIGGEALSTSTDANGAYTLFNVPEGSADLSAWRAGYNFTPVTGAEVAASGETSADIVASGNAAGTVSGSLSFVAGGQPTFPVDVTLLHPITGDVIPGLRTFTEGTSTNYTLTGVPDGNFHAIASMETDGYVLDPDFVVKQGVPAVTFTAGTPTPSPLNFTLTGSILMTSPLGKPVIPVGEDLLIGWDKNSSYSSAKYYVFELIDESGDVVAGGFNTFDWFIEAVGGSHYDETFDTSDLEPGRYYQIRVYVLDDAGTKGIPDAGDKILSSTENLEGVFFVAQSLACTDGLDNDGDGWADATDPDCASDHDELGYGMTQCNNGTDDDADTFIDATDPQCTNALDDDETN